MAKKLDLGRVMREATRILVGWPVAVCAPLLVSGSAIWAINEAMRRKLPHGVGGPMVLLLAMFSPLWTEWMSLVVARIGWLRCRGEMSTVGWFDVLRFPGVPGTIVGLWGRFLAWGAGTTFAAGCAAFLALVIWLIGNPPAHHGAGKLFLHHPTALWIGIMVWIVILYLLLSRYALVMPLVAIEGRAGPGAIEKGVWLMGRFWQSVVAVILIEVLVSVVGAESVGRFLHPHLTGIRFAWAGAQLVLTLVQAIFTSWMVLVRLGLAAQAGWLEFGQRTPAVEGTQTIGL